jgi:hypothetical protein
VTAASITAWTTESRGHTGYWLAGLIFLAGLVIGVGYAVAAISGALSASDRFDRTTVGGSVSVTVDAAGPMVIYSETSTVPSLASLGLTVVGPTGEPVAVRPYVADLRYDREGGLGTAVATFTASAAGIYQVSSEATHTSAVLAVGPDIGGYLVDALGRAGLICGLALAGALAVVVATSATARS